MGREVYFWKRSYGELKWIEPYPIVNVLPHQICLQISPKTSKWFYNDRISPTAKVLQTRDGTPQNASSEMASSEISGVNPYKFLDLPEIQQLTQSQLDKIQATQKLMRLNQPNEELGHANALNNAPPEPAQTDALSSANPRVPPAPDAPINETVEYLRDLSHRVYNSPLGDTSAFTPGELNYWNSCTPWDSNILLTGDPPHPPERKRNLIAFADPEDYIPPPPPQEDLPEPMPPLPTGSSGTTTNSAPTPTPKTPVPPVDLNHDLAPVKKKTTAARMKFSLRKTPPEVLLRLQKVCRPVNMVLSPRRALRALHTLPLLLHRDPHHPSDYWGSNSDSSQRLRPTQLVDSTSLSIWCPCLPGRPLDRQGGPDSVPSHGASGRKSSTARHQVRPIGFKIAAPSKLQPRQCQCPHKSYINHPLTPTSIYLPSISISPTRTRNFQTTGRI
jgi:hypothetical protein